MHNRHQIKSIIIEDNKESQVFLKNTLTLNYPQIEVLGFAASIKDSIVLIQNTDPELVFMDIELEDGYSFEIFKTITNPNFEVLFVTAFNEYLHKAMEHFALSYITKPIDVIELKRAVGHYLQLRSRLFSIEKLTLTRSLLDNKEGKIFIHTTNEHLLVQVKDIIKIEADGNYTNFYLTNEFVHLASNNLKYYESILPKTTFFRASRFVLVNMNYVARIHKKGSIILHNGDQVHVSARNKSKLNEFINSLS